MKNQNDILEAILGQVQKQNNYNSTHSKIADQLTNTIDYDNDIASLKCISKKRSIKAIMKNKVLNRKKYNKWYKKDDKLLSSSIKEYFISDGIKNKKAKKLAKNASKRILKSFYQNPDKKRNRNRI